MNRKTIRSIGLLGLLLISGCSSWFRPALVKTIDGQWTSALDGDLRVAAAHADAYFASNGWPIQLRWAGVRGSSYYIERGPLGEPLRESVQVLYAFYYPAQNKCFLSYQAQSPRYLVRLSREHLGGGQYGTPEIIGFEPLAGGDPVGPEVVCSAIDNASGGVHVGGAAPTGSPPAAAVASTRPPATLVLAKADDPMVAQDALAQLAPGLPAACSEYVRLTCLNPDMPVGTDRRAFCAHMVDQMNTQGMKPGAAKSCRTMLNNRSR